MLREMFCVCKLNGMLLILDVFLLMGIFGAVLRLWLRFVLSFVGALMMGEKKVYVYLGILIECVRMFREVVDEFEVFGVEVVEILVLFLFGVVSVIIARKSFDGSSK